MGKLTVGILTTSDRCSRGLATDTSEPALRQLLEEDNGNWTVTDTKIISDNKQLISHTVQQWGHNKLSLIIVTGGTGISPTDVTVEAIEPLFTKRLPSLATAMVVGSLKITPMAALSQVTAGVVGPNGTVVVAVPGSKKGSVENLKQILGVLPHAVQVAGTKEEGTRHLHKEEQPAVSSIMCGCGRPEEDKKEGEVPATNRLDDSVSRRARKSPFPMIPVKEALAKVLEYMAPLPATDLPLADVREGQVVAQDIVAQENVPAYPASIMDGYAVIASDGPGVYQVCGSTTAGANHQDTVLKSMEIARVATGAPIPQGADAVVMVEDTEVVETNEAGEELKVRILASGAVVAGQHIRPVGHDLAKGAVILRAGTVISAIGGEIGTMAISGNTRFSMYTMPRIAVMSSGDEVVDALGPSNVTELPYGAIRDSNRPSLIAALRALNCCEVIDLGVIRDDPDTLSDTMKEALNRCHGIITTGGVSMGERDWLKPVIEQRLQGTLQFGRVAMKPSKPTTFATLPDNKFIFALPGNPVSALVAFHMFVSPAIRKLAGQPHTDTHRVVSAVLECQQPVKLDRVRPEYVRGSLIWQDGKWKTRMVDTRQQSSRMASMLGANCLISLPIGTITQPTVEAGEHLPCIVIGTPYFHQ